MMDHLSDMTALLTILSLGIAYVCDWGATRETLG